MRARPDAGACAHRQPPRARAACRSPAGRYAARRDGASSLAAAAPRRARWRWCRVQLQSVRGFAEIAEIVFPHCPMPDARTVPRCCDVRCTSQRVARSQQLARARSASSTRPSAPARTRFAPVAPAHPSHLLAPVAPTAPIAPVHLIAPIRPHARLRARIQRRTRPSWRLPANATHGMARVATPGVEIASTAKKTSIGIANVFSRAGVSLARSF